MHTKTQPAQERSRQTFEAILAAAAALLEEVGIDNLSTNLICARASLTPPALYRYFPNKYALLRELGVRLMAVQDQAIFDWIAGGGLDAGTLNEAFEKTYALQKDLHAITRAQPAALWIARAMRAVPMLRQVRIESRDRVAAALFAALRVRLAETSEETLKMAVRVGVEMGTAALEMMLEEPDAASDDIIAELSWFQVMYYARLS